MSQKRSAHSRRQASVDYPRYPPYPAAQNQAQPLQHHLLQPSDYESDTPAYLSDYPVPAPPTGRTTNELNLSVLKRHNPAIASILSVAPYAVVYEFSPLPEPTWSKTGVEGSLFICQLDQRPFGEDAYLAFVLNRRGLHNFEAELRESDDAGVEITEEYVIVSFKEGQEQKINGIFVYSDGPGTSTEHTRALNGDLMKQLAIQAGLSRKAAEAAAAAAAAESTTTHTNGHIREAESAVDSQLGGPVGRQINLQQLFGQQRRDDAGWGVRMHSPQGPTQFDGASDFPRGYNDSRQPQLGPQLGPQPTAQQDVLGDLFRRAGLGTR